MIFSKQRFKYLLLGVVIIIVIDYFGLLSHVLEVDYYSRFSYPLDIPMEEALLAMKNGAKPAVTPINNYDYRYKIKNEKKCKQDNDNEYDKIVILYVIKSAIDNQHRRDGIRKSWGWENRFSDVIIRRIFVLGMNNDPKAQDLIDEEYARNKDIVQVDFFDSYYNNTIKTMVGFKWVVQNCPKVQFITFSDDDMYISTKNLLKFLRNPFNRQIGFRKRRSIEQVSSVRNYMQDKSDDTFQTNKTQTNLHRKLQSVIYYSSHEAPKRQQLEIDPALSAFDGRLLAGYVFFSSPMRHKSSKWYITLAEYPYSKYPPYVTAGAYVMSYPALIDIYHTSLFTKLFKFDDVYLGIVAKKCGIAPLHNDNFYFWKKSYNKDSYADVIASHGFGNPGELRKVWEEQRSLGHA